MLLQNKEKILGEGGLEEGTLLHWNIIRAMYVRCMWKFWDEQYQW